MAKRSKLSKPMAVVEKKPAEAKVEHPVRETPLCWESFFYGRSPVLRSELLTMLMAGSPLQVERLPAAVLLDVVLMATASRELFNAEIVDNYQLLLERTEELWKQPDWTTRVFDSNHARWANAIINHGVRTFDSPEEAYIPAMVQWYLEHDPPKYFVKEIKEAA